MKPLPYFIVPIFLFFVVFYYGNRLFGNEDGVTSRIAIPTTDRPELSTLIFEAIKEGKKKIDIPKNEYSLELKNGRPMIFENLKDVEIDGNGSNVFCRIPSQIIAMKKCENVKIKGFSFDTLVLPYTQGTVVDVDSEQGKWIDIEIHDGYEKENVTNDRIQVFDPISMHLKRNLWTFFNEKIAKQDNGNWRILFPQENKNRRIEIGDLMVLGAKSPEPLWTHTIVTDDSNHCVFEDITLYFSNCFAFLENGCHGNHYFRCRLIKKKDDPTKAFPRLRSGNADSFHSKFATLGPRVEDCEFRDHGDDCIAINGNFYLVVSSTENKVCIFERHGHRLRIEIGDPVRFTGFEGTVLGDAKVLSIEKRDDLVKETILEVVKRYHVHGSGNDLPPNHRIFELTLDKPIPVESGGNVYALNRIGDGFIVRNNKIGFTRARGVLVKCGNGEISGNTIVGCELAGIVVAPELYWLEAGYSENLLIENNIVRNCFFHNNRWGESQPAVISIVAVNSKGDVMQAGTMKNIILRNNTVSDSPYPALLLASIEGGQIEDNTFRPPSDETKRKHGQRFAEKYKFDYDTPIWQINNSTLKIE